MTGSILIIEDEDTLRQSLCRIFTKEGYYVDSVDTAEKAFYMMENSFYDVVITDIVLPGIDGIEMINKVKQFNPEQIFIVITAYASVETAVKALRAGAYDYIMKPIIHEEIKQVVRNALLQKRLQIENIFLKRQIKRNYDFSSIVGNSPAISKIVEEVEKVSDTKSNILLLGETGTGKELFAKVIHQNSSRREMPFIPINCSAIPEGLIESELFGHVKGAFTGAVSTKKGLFEEADGGTVFLDEIGDIPLSFQAKLLRVIEEQQIRPVGSTKIKKVNLRFIAATNKDLSESIKKGEFREDLYYRINVITLKLPPLRHRKEDIPMLVRHYLKKYSQELGKNIEDISEEAMSLMINYDWPGNVRELQNVIERAVLLSDRSVIGVEELPDNIKKIDSFVVEALKNELSIEEYTKAFILKFQHIYNEQELAEKLGITRKTLWEKRKKWNLKKV